MGLGLWAPQNMAVVSWAKDEEHGFRAVGTACRTWGGQVVGAARRSMTGCGHRVEHAVGTARRTWVSGCVRRMENMGVGPWAPPEEHGSRAVGTARNTWVSGRGHRVKTMGLGLRAHCMEHMRVVPWAPRAKRGCQARHKKPLCAQRSAWQQHGCTPG